MDVEFVTNAVAGGWDPRRLEEGLGGSEECVTLLAEALARRGLKVAVYASLAASASPNSDGPPRSIGGFTHHSVAWRPRGAFDPAAPRHALVGFKEPALWLFPARANVTVHWSSDAEPALKPALLARVGRVVALSANHAERLAWAPRERLSVVPHGVGAAFLSGAGTPWREREPLLLACSSPDRGLERLLLDWPRLVRAHSALRLAVAYGFPRTPPSPWRANLEHLLAQPGILPLGTVRESELAEWMRRARYWVHPLNAPAAELFCLSAVKAQALGALPVTQHVADSGLRDTVRRYIPYAAFVRGSTEPEANPAARTDLPLSWDQVAERWWLPLLELAEPKRRPASQANNTPPLPRERGQGGEAQSGGAR